MDYSRIYETLCTLGKTKRPKDINKGRFEKHHIIPRHAGGDNSPDNITTLYRKEHILAHHLLYKIHGRRGDRLAYLMMRGVLSSLWDDPEYRERMLGRVVANLARVDRVKAGKAAAKATEYQQASKIGIFSEEGKALTRKAYLKWCKANPDKKSALAEYMHTEDARAKMAASKTKGKPIGPDGTVYSSIKEAASITGIARHNIDNWIRRGHFGWSREASPE